ncbi:MAG TPA: hypothetical protein PKY81_05990 [bacterium]|nr:hypothetical protein [bacterium]HPN30490.1 hypothetical protein [bacterium]
MKTQKTKNNATKKKSNASKQKQNSELTPEELKLIAGGLSTDPTEDEPFLPGMYKILH